jgi:outer membrane lipoprotein-sorting protein
MKTALVALATASLLGTLASSRVAHATPPDPALLEKLAHNEQEIEATAKRATYHAEEVVEQLDGDGKVASTKTSHYHVELDGTTRHHVIDNAVEDGKDVTAKEQEEARSKEAERASKKKKDPQVWPFAPGSEAKYDYDQVAVNPAHPDMVEIAFKPKSPDSETFEGKVWVDATNGKILSASVRMSKPPMLVDWVHLTAEFSSTAAGPALSRITFEGSGGLLFIHKHFRGHVAMSDWR